MPDPEKRLTHEILLKRYKWIAPLSCRHVLYLNPLIYGAFKKVRSEDQVALAGYFLDEAETELGLFWSADGTDLLKLRPNKSDRTAEVYLSLLCAKYPGLKVERGRVRPFPVELRPYEGTQALVILTAGVDSVPSGTEY